MTAIERQWSWLLHSADIPSMTRDVVRAASDRIPLRVLFPYISLGRILRFSRATDYPYSDDFPSIRCIDPDEDRAGAQYEVRGADRHPGIFSDLSRALDAVIDLLPAARTVTEFDRLWHAVLSPAPRDLLIRIIHDWKAEGCSQREAERRLTTFLAEVSASATPELDDPVRDVLDLVVGHCSDHLRLFPDQA